MDNRDSLSNSFKDRARGFLDALLPRYTRVPLASCLLFNMVVYFGIRLFTGGLRHYDFTLPIDEAIPFVPAFITVYLLIYVQWVAGYIVIARDSRKLCYRMLSGEIIAKFICLIFFIALPTTMVRGEIVSDDIFSSITGLIYALDPPDNLFPSIHCLESWLCFRGAMKLKNVGKWYGWLSLALAIATFASVLFVKQHIVVDIIGGVLAAEAGLALSRLTGAERIFEKLENSHEKS